MLKISKKLFPLNRSLGGRANILTLNILKKNIKNFKIKKFNSGSLVYDWKIPKAWEVKSAYIITPDKKKICDYKKNNLHLMAYSKSVNKVLNLREIKKKIFSIKKSPNAIPYKTSYYKKDWAFCLEDRIKKNLKPGNYKVFIKTVFVNSFLPYGEIIIKGKSKKEVLLSTYICHPSMANNEISGMVVTREIAKWIQKKKRYYSYRILFLPETIGSISYIKKNFNKLKKNIFAGYQITCIGDERQFSIMPSKQGNSISDRVAKKILKTLKGKKRIYNWLQRGSDERQYCSPLVNLPICSLMRSKYWDYKEYHTSLDRIGNVVTAKGLKGGFEFVKKIINEVESIRLPIATKPCEPFLLKYNIWKNKKNSYHPTNFVHNILNFISYCDGDKTVDEISKIVKIGIREKNKLLEVIYKKKLIKFF